MCNDLLVPQGGSIAPRSRLSKFHTEKLFIILYYYYFYYLLLLYILRLLTSFHIWTLTLKNVKPEANLDFFVFLFSLQEESIEEVIKDTESLFKSREKEYQETIDQIEVRRSGAVGRVK